MSVDVPVLVDPPRAVPAGAVLEILRGNGFVAALWYAVPAMFLLPGFAFEPARTATFVRVAFGVLGTLLLWPALTTMAHAVARTLATVRRMRRGCASAGRIVSCHFAWDSRRQEMTYEEFVAGWQNVLAHSQMSKATGCIVKAALLFVGLPALLVAVAVGIAFGMRAWGVAAPGWGEPDSGELLSIVGYEALFFIGVALMAALWRWRVVRTADVLVAAEQQGITVAQVPGALELEELARLAAERAREHPVKQPLPGEEKPVEIACQVEYACQAGKRSAAARVPFTCRLAPGGLEPLLYDPARPAQVDLFAALPRSVAVSSGRWTCPLRPSTAIGVAIATAFVAAALDVVALGVLRLAA